MIICYNPDLVRNKRIDNPEICGNEDTTRKGDKTKHVLNTAMLKSSYVVDCKFDKL